MHVGTAIPVEIREISARAFHSPLVPGALRSPFVSGSLDIPAAKVILDRPVSRELVGPDHVCLSVAVHVGPVEIGPVLLLGGLELINVLPSIVPINPAPGAAVLLNAQVIGLAVPRNVRKMDRTVKETKASVLGAVELGCGTTMVLPVKLPGFFDHVPPHLDLVLIVGVGPNDIAGSVAVPVREMQIAPVKFGANLLLGRVEDDLIASPEA